MELLRKIEKKEREYYEKLTNPTGELYRKGRTVGKVVAIGLIGIGGLVAIKGSPLLGASSFLLGSVSLVAHLVSKK